jgi:isoquinoline 1-oxidoreductase subunit beta
MRAALASPDSYPSRRAFLRASAALGGGMLLSLHFERPALAQAAGPTKQYPSDAFVRIGDDDAITINVIYIELGQGVATSLPMVLADEMDADWSKVTAELAPAAEVYKSPVFGFQMTGGSASIASSFQQYRELGAKARAMLISVAARRWSIRPDQCRTESSVVFGPDGRSARYADLARDAAKLPIPEHVALKTPSEFRLIGKPVRRLDNQPKCDGSQRFGLDRDLPGALTAVMVLPPVRGGRVKVIDDREARSVTGVRGVFAIPLLTGEAAVVVADRFWTAKRARDLLKIDWDDTGLQRADSAELRKEFTRLARTPGSTAVSRGDTKALERIPDRDRIVAEYEFPYLAHTPMEPLNATARFDGDRAEVWVGSQLPTIEQGQVANALGLKPKQVTFHIEYAGGGFGRRGTFDGHVPVAAALVAKRFPGAPVKFVWTREEDVRGGEYRPMCVHRVEIGVDGLGTPAAWRHTVVGQSFLVGTGSPFESVLVRNGVDALVVEGAADTLYNLPNFLVTAHHPNVNVKVFSWRSVGHTHNDFVMETLIDELATRAKADPIAYRLALLDANAKRLRAALTLLDERSTWRQSPSPGHAVGIACGVYHDTASACVAEVSIQKGKPRIHRVTAAVDCGLAVNPLSIEAQFQGGFIFGLSQLLPKGAITLKDGQVEQSNFNDFIPPYIVDAPVSVDVHIVKSTDPPTAIGECPVPIISPAVVNALYRLTGKRYRRLPLTRL